MSIKNLIHDTLVAQVGFRERSRRSIGFTTLIKRLYPTLEPIESKTLMEAMETFETMSRVWRQVLQENPALQGMDYDQKEVLEKNTQEVLGYSVGESYGEFSNLKL